MGWGREGWIGFQGKDDECYDLVGYAGLLALLCGDFCSAAVRQGVFGLVLFL